MKESLLANTTISHYRILSRIGAGGMGEVYLAEDTKLDRKVALKLLPAEFTKHRDRLGRFLQEAKAAAALSHPNVAHIYEVNESDGWHFIAMEYVEGETLRNRLAHRKLSLPEALEVAMQVVNALASAHAAGIVHRDIKPENIMLKSDSYVKVLDFGLAKLTDQPRASGTDSDMATVARVDTDPGTVMGTSGYMSPEQARGKPVDARSDIFSLGIVLYEMIAGQPPFQGETTGDVIVALLDREPLALTRVSPETPAELQRIVSKALRKDQEERYQTSKDLLVDLRSLKQELEFEVKLERSIHPEASVVRMTGLGSGSAVTPAAVPFASSGSDLRATSSAEYLISEIKEHKRAMAVILSGVAVTVVVFAYLLYFAGDSKTIDSIAVLPLVNTSADPNAEYLSDGITESLINNLTQLPKLRVVARSTVFRYKGKEVDPQQVGRELNVRAVLMGRVLQRGETLTMQVDLVNVSDGSQIWGQQYNRKAADLVAVQQDIAREVTEKLRLRLSGEEQKQLTKRDAANADAYQFYLKGRFYWNKRTADGINKAIEQFQQAIDKDPNYALAHVGLADCYLVLEQYAGNPASETLPKAKSAAQRALQIDESLAEVHSSLGLISEDYWQWEEAEREYKRAISLNPNYPTAHHWYSIFLRSVGRSDEAAAEIHRAQQLDPLSPIISKNVADTLLLKGDLDAALQECKKTIELSPNFPAIREGLGWVYLKQQRYSEAITELEKAVELSGKTSEYLGELGHGYAVAGRRAEALAILKELEEKYAKRESPGKDLAAVYVGLGEKNQSLSWIEKDLDQQSTTLHFVLWYPTFDPLRSEARYTAMLRRMRLTTGAAYDKGAR